VLNTLSAATTLPGAILAYFWLENTRALLTYVLALSAASFIYIATAHLVPNLHRRVMLKNAVYQVAQMLLGIGTIALFHVGHAR
jgi:zinc and cadmium transporter